MATTQGIMRLSSTGLNNSEIPAINAITRAKIGEMKIARDMVAIIKPPKNPSSDLLL